MDPDKFPPIPDTLINALSDVFPDRSPRKGESMEDLMFRGGQRNVVEWLRRMAAGQQP